MSFLIRYIFLIVFSAAHSLSFSQSNFTIPDSINYFVFSKGANDQIKLITPFGNHVLEDSVFIYEKFKDLNFPKQINDIGRPLNNTEYRSIVLNEKLHLFHNGGVLFLKNLRVRLEELIIRHFTLIKQVVFILK